MHFSELSGHPDLLAGLDTEPLVDYLRKHGVVSAATSEEIMRTEGQQEKNRLLLSAVQKCNEEGLKKDKDPSDDSTPIAGNAFGLFINALRHTGYHRLASLLDNERRIVPALKRGSRASIIGYHARTRRRGQVAVLVQVSAVKVSATKYGLLEGPSHTQTVRSASNPPRPTSLPPSSRNGHHPLVWAQGGGRAGSERSPTRQDCWIGLDELKNSPLWGKGSDPACGGLQQDPQVPATVLQDPQLDSSDTSCFSCLCCLFSKKKKKSQAVYILPAATSTSTAAAGDCYLADKSQSDQDVSLPGQQEVEKKASILNRKSELFYQTLHDSGTQEHESLLKYFEQQVGVLVLDSFFDEAFVIVVICTKAAKLESLKSRQVSGALSRDLEKHMLSDSLLQSLGVRRIKLAVDIDADEYKLALGELQDN